MSKKEHLVDRIKRERAEDIKRVGYNTFVLATESRLRETEKVLRDNGFKNFLIFPIHERPKYTLKRRGILCINSQGARLSHQNGVYYIYPLT